MDESGRLRIVMVCTANICRSPMAEALMRAEADRRYVPVDVSSAGFLFDGEPASDRAAAVMAERGLDLSSHRSRRIGPTLARSADLVLTAERIHARDVVVDAPDVLGRVHTLGGFAAAVTSPDLLGVDGPRERIALIGERRSNSALVGSGPEEIPDPHGGSKRRHRATAAVIESLVAEVLDGLWPPD